MYPEIFEHHIVDDPNDAEQFLAQFFFAYSDLDHTLHGKVYEGYMEDGEFLYKNRLNPSEYAPNTSESLREIWFSFVFCSRGIWESRIYFPDGNEYWGENLKTIALVWEQLEPVLIKKLQEKHPEWDWK